MPAIQSHLPTSRAIRTILSSKSTCCERLRVSQLSDLFQRHQPDAVMHLAAESHVDRSIDGPGEFIQTNIVGTFNLLQASLAYWRSLPKIELPSVERSQTLDFSFARKAAQSSHSQETFRFLHVSTDEVYGSLAPTPPASPRRTPTIRTRRIPPRRPRRITSRGLGPTPTDCRYW